MNTYAIGDIQGCYDELRQLLDRLGFDDTNDNLWLTGDLVNRGPQSLEVLRFVRSLKDRAVVVLGNHDLHLLAAANTTGRRNADTGIQPILDAPDREELLEWLRHRPFLHEDPDLNFTLIHAGLPPQWDMATARFCAREVEAILQGSDYPNLLAEMYGDEPRQWKPELQGMERWRFTINCFTRLRYCTADGALALRHKGPPGQLPGEILPWFKAPARRTRGQRLLFGHWSALGPVIWNEDLVYGLDTGCVWGGKLTALRLTRDAVDPEHLTMLPCRGHRDVSK